ncbi:hypothetical protein EJ04DRAFT_576797 [Polyplosphaeria fusca]|uniref:Rhodopsin domain-containing protein n=1 Tax=Polyplosphaeria fusca TaxID=682080 RepID=A0A9P4QVM6_9PLEO|nr:hypothetical protein EJ04DRAFT_576797 [Polyplosphaeria fusca]
MTDSNAPKLVASMWSITVIALVFFISRIYLKRRYGKKITTDDYLLGLSWIFTLLYTVSIYIATQYGLGHHLRDVSEDNLPKALMYMTIGEFLGLLGLQASKTSFAMTLLRLAVQQWQKWMLWFVIISLNLVLGLNTILIFSWCQPVQKLWNFSSPGTCWDAQLVIRIAVAAGSYSGIMDLLLAVFPVVLLWNLRIERREKVGVCVAMSLGVVAGVAAFVKTSYLPLLGEMTDLTYSMIPLLVWAAAEGAVTIVATSVPYIRLAYRARRNRDRGHRVEDAEIGMAHVNVESKTALWRTPMFLGRSIALLSFFARVPTTGEERDKSGDQGTERSVRDGPT